MRFARLLEIVGMMMIRTGVIVLLFAAYQLWGTGIETERAQNTLEDEWKVYVAQLEDRADTESSTSTAPTTTNSDSSAPTTTSAPVTTTTLTPAHGAGAEAPHLDPDEVASIGEVPPPEPGQAIGRIEIPDLDVDWYMVEGVDLSLLRKGPGHFPETPMPGQKGNSAFAGHRTTYGAPFHNLDRLDPGDDIYVTTFQGKFHYEVLPIPVIDGKAHGLPPTKPETESTVTLPGAEGEVSPRRSTTTVPADPVGLPINPGEAEGWFVVDPGQHEILSDYGDNRLTLMACHPKYSASRRIVVSATLVDDPAPPIEYTDDPTKGRDPDGGNGSVDGHGQAHEGDLIAQGGDPAARVPTALWGLAAAAVWWATWFFGQRWKRWAAYLIGAPIFLVVLFFCFENLTNLLPAAY